ncbi:RIP metalloprotease RseP [Peribacillus psychrosaccharolyticus]|uniref:Zinc metalloprotease n=1 Tax=Peribacillus psychrosaccharolyticus TaxID=1407 RepID=A0A974S1B1_PERPY|nr:RIP metalloprotease RseP [Peribacillus psychrosaccharolyticus]MEC2053839.1 RIP metalloprotease RseP [Peribacillus psychrosaccharolyticus]MED3742547.1 RIP metalloprotease RseP [Peribacillus psychrosaccharolyticus]QQT01497.1 RIP metalloprotease RseP [Peribacillus psychrosaccharolyticus]
MLTVQTIVAFIVIFGSLVFFHELGHLVFAKRAGILCREFAIGFGPKVFTYKKNETVYTIRLLPLGGYVRMAGEDAENPELKPGYRVGLLFNSEEIVTKIVLDNKDKYPDLRVIEVEAADLEHKLIIQGYEEGEEDTLQTFKIVEDAVVVSEGVENQIAPFERQFNSKSLGHRTMTIFAGPMMNFVLAFVIFVIIGLFQGVAVDEPRLGELTADGSAITSGLKNGDEIQSIDGNEVSSWQDVQEAIQKNPGKEIEFVVERGNKTEEILVVPQEVDREGEKVGVIGVYPPVEKSPINAFKYGFTETYFWTKQIFVILGSLITGGFSLDALSGPVGIYKSTEEVAKSGIFYLMKWAGLLSINLGIMNLLPLPALDGGRLLFFLVEFLRGKPIDRQKEGLVHFVGFALLMLLMILVTWNDIQRFFL